MAREFVPSGRVALLGLALLALPAIAHAQSTLTGVVKDASGAVLPGVTVEAASPVLIEKTRSVVTDGTGGYRLTDLRPGTYTLTFSLEGFSSIKREGLELPDDSEYRFEGWCTRGNVDGHRRFTARRRAESDEVPGAQPRCSRRHSN